MTLSSPPANPSPHKLTAGSWITPSIFESVSQTLDIVDEYTLCERLPHAAPRILREH
jgi:hypothetical protein